MNYLSIYRVITQICKPFLFVYMALRKIKGKEDLNRFGERLGICEKNRPLGKLIWFHGASVGETLSILPLIKKIQETYPNLNIMVTSGTVTSAGLMAKRLSGKAFHQYVPIDCPKEVERFVDHWAPDAVFWIESEFWPNLLSAIHRRNIPLILINGRISDKSFNSWKKYLKISQQIQSLFTKSFGQTNEDARRLSVLGAKETDCVGNIKFAGGELPVDGDELSKMIHEVGKRPVWVAASTHSGEEEQIAEAHSAVLKQHEDALLILAPRHPMRSKEIENIFKQAGMVVAVRSRGEKITERVNVYISDTIGEMGLVYRLGSVAFVGGSLIEFGGQNIIEPARLKKAVLSGKYMMNFREIVVMAKEADALIEVENAEQLGEQVKNLFADEKLLKSKQENALKFALAQEGVLDKLVNVVAEFFE